MRQQRVARARAFAAAVGDGNRALAPLWTCLGGEEIKPGTTAFDRLPTIMAERHDKLTGGYGAELERCRQLTSTAHGRLAAAVPPNEWSDRFGKYLAAVTALNAAVGALADAVAGEAARDKAAQLIDQKAEAPNDGGALIRFAGCALKMDAAAATVDALAIGLVDRCFKADPAPFLAEAAERCGDELGAATPKTAGGTGRQPGTEQLRVARALQHCARTARGNRLAATRAAVRTAAQQTVETGAPLADAVALR